MYNKEKRYIELIEQILMFESKINKIYKKNEIVTEDNKYISSEYNIKPSAIFLIFSFCIVILLAFYGTKNSYILGSSLFFASFFFYNFIINPQENNIFHSFLFNNQYLKNIRRHYHLKFIRKNRYKKVLFLKKKALYIKELKEFHETARIHEIEKEIDQLEKNIEFDKLCKEVIPMIVKGEIYYSSNYFFNILKPTLNIKDIIKLDAIILKNNTKFHNECLLKEELKEFNKI